MQLCAGSAANTVRPRRPGPRECNDPSNSKQLAATNDANGEPQDLAHRRILSQPPRCRRYMILCTNCWNMYSQGRGGERNAQSIRCRLTQAHLLQHGCHSHSLTLMIHRCKVTQARSRSSNAHTHSHSLTLMFMLCRHSLSLFFGAG